MSVNVNLFEGIKECSSEEQSLIAALLEHGHLGTIIGPLLYEKVEPCLMKWNIPASKLTFEEMIQISKEKYLKLSIDERNKKLIEIITSRLGYDNIKDSESISLLVLQRVARIYGIDEIALPRDMAYRVMMKFFEKMEKAYKEAWEKADDAKRKEFDEKIEERINKMSESERREIQAALHLDQLSAATVRNVIINTSPAVLLSSVVNIAGFSAYMALSIMVHAIFTTVLGITLPFGVYMGLSSALSTVSGPLAPLLICGGALFAWIKSSKELNNNLLEMVVGMGLIRMFLRGDLNPIDQKYLSYSTESDKSVFIEENKYIEDLKKSIEKTKADWNKQDNAIHSKQALLSDLKCKDNHSIALIEAYKGELASSPKFIQPPKNDNLTKQSEDSNDLLRQIERANIDKETALRLAEEEEYKRILYLKEMKEKQEIIEKLKETIQDLKKNQIRNEYKLNGILKKREEDIRFRFEAIYTHIVISDKTYKWLASQTDRHVVVAAEAAIREYNDGNFSLHYRGKITGTSFYHNSFGPKDAYRIYYWKPNDKVVIADIGHKNSQNENIQWLQTHTGVC